MPKSETTNEKRIERLEKTVIQLQDQLNRLYEARMIDHNRAIDQAVQNSGSNSYGIF